MAVLLVLHPLADQVHGAVPDSGDVEGVIHPSPALEGPSRLRALLCPVHVEDALEQRLVGGYWGGFW
jgi:hypothetical protein